ncbi:hypothetical protein ACJ41O_014827 [Fusarium nematophilum]
MTGPHTEAATAAADIDKDFPKSNHLEGPMRDYDVGEIVTYTPEENKAVKRKIDFILLPMMCACYIFSFLDKTLLNYASIFGIKEALHLEGSDYSWLGRQDSRKMAKERREVHRRRRVCLVRDRAPHSYAILLSAWPSLITSTAVCTNFAGIMAVRFFLGFFESIIGPVFVIVTSNWWTRPEQAFRTAFWLAGTPIGNFFGGILSYALVHGSVATWKIFFLFFGSLSLGFSFVLMYLMPNNQNTARWLDEREKKIAIERVRENQTVTADDHWKWHQFWEALRDPQTIFFFVTAVGNTMPSTFASQIVKGFGFSAIQTTLISTCPAAVIQLSTFLVFSYIASRHNNIRLYLSILVSIPPLIGASLLHTLPTSNTAGRLAGYYLTYTHSMSFTLSAGLMASNYAGNTKKSTASGFIFAGWAAGLIAGPQFFLEREAPNYDLAFKMLMGCYALMVILPIMQLIWYKYENGRRDRLSGGSVAGIRPEFTDDTDFEQWRTFRYTM